MSASGGTQPEAYTYYESERQIFGDQKGHGCPLRELTVKSQTPLPKSCKSRIAKGDVGLDCEEIQNLVKTL